MWRVGTVVALHDETATARTITLKVPDWPNHVGGQHVDVRLTASDGYSTVRSYSIASAPGPQGRIELTIERLPNGEVSPYLAQELAVGDRLELRGPIGGWFVWRSEQTEPIHDSLACFGGQHRAVSIAVFGTRTTSDFLPR
jgi:ferredoxin-NADP reductase